MKIYADDRLISLVYYTVNPKQYYAMYLNSSYDLMGYVHLYQTVWCKTFVTFQNVS